METLFEIATNTMVWYSFKDDPPGLKEQTFEEVIRNRAIKAMTYSKMEPNKKDGTNYIGVIKLIYGTE